MGTGTKSTHSVGYGQVSFALPPKSSSQVQGGWGGGGQNEKIDWGTLLSPKMMIVSEVRHQISHTGVCYMNNPPKRGNMAPMPVPDLTTSLRRDFPYTESVLAPASLAGCSLGLKESTIQRLSCADRAFAGIQTNGFQAPFTPRLRYTLHTLVIQLRSPNVACTPPTKAHPEYPPPPMSPPPPRVGDCHQMTVPPNPRGEGGGRTPHNNHLNSSIPD